LRRFFLPLFVTLLFGACRIEQTPQRFIDHQLTPAEEIAASEAELTSRLNAMIAALQRRNAGEAAGILRPHPDVRAIGPGEGEWLVEPDGIAAALDELAGPGPGAADHIAVTVGPRNNIAWFSVGYSSPTDPGEATFRFSGVFIRQDGEWRLVDGHLSRPYVSYSDADQSDADPPA
jgi:hypothetical protein